MSIKKQLPFSYAVVVLLSVLVLGAALYLILQNHYSQLEKENMQIYASAISAGIAPLFNEYVSQQELETQLQAISLLSHTRIRLLDLEGEVIADSGPPPVDAVDLLQASRLITGDLPVWKENPGQILSLATRIPLEAPIQDGEWPAGRIDPTDFPWAEGRGLLDGSYPLPVERSAVVLTNAVNDAEGNQIAILELSEGPALSKSIIENAMIAWGIAGTAAVILATLGGWLISRRYTQPLAALNSAATSMAAGSLSERADIRRKDEFGGVAAAFNRMAEQVEKQLLAMRRFVGDAAHGIHTPITALRTNLELAMRNPAEEKGDHLSRALEQLTRIEDLSENLLMLSRAESATDAREFHEVDLVKITTDLHEIFASAAEQAGIDFRLDVPEAPVFIHGNQENLSVMIGNLLDNALKFTPAGGEVTAQLTCQENEAVLVVTDTGIGIPAEDTQKLFIRFQRCRNASSYPGSGLGLAIVKAVVDSHHGHVAIEARKVGTRFIVRFPLLSLSKT